MSDTLHNKTILIIDDDPQVHKLLETMLSAHGCVVQSAMNAQQGWKIINEEKPDLIVLDIMMPDMSGIELCEKIRQSARLKNLLILMLSAKESQSDRLVGLKYGADDYVTKPFHVASLVRKLEHMFEK